MWIMTGLSFAAVVTRLYIRLVIMRKKPEPADYILVFGWLTCPALATHAVFTIRLGALSDIEPTPSNLITIYKVLCVIATDKG
jgi:hypothetical protein